MAIPSSGPLALTDVQTEFGGSNPIGINEYYAGGSFVPAGTSGTYGAVPSSGQISLQNFYGTSNIVYGINNVANTVITAYGAAVDPSGNIYVVTGYNNGATSTWVGKYTSNLALIWQRTIGGNGYTFTAYGGCNADASGVYINANENGGTSYMTVKLNSSDGSTSYQQRNVASFNFGATSSFIDSSGNFYGQGCGWIKLDSAGTFVSWYIPNSQSGQVVKGGALTTTGTAGDIIYCWNQGTYLFATRYTAPMSRVWGRQSSNSGQFYVTSRPIQTLASTGNFSLSYYTSSSTYLGLAIIDQASANTVSSIVGLTSSNTFRNFGQSTKDSSDNIYVSVSIGSPYQWVVILKYNSSGTLQWIRKFVASGYDCQCFGLVASGSSLIFTANYNNTFSIVKVPTDGSKTGAWTVNGASLSYAVDSSFTDIGAGFGQINNNTSVASVGTTSTTLSTTNSAGGYSNTLQII